MSPSLIKDYIQLKLINWDNSKFYWSQRGPILLCSLQVSVKSNWLSDFVAINKRPEVWRKAYFFSDCATCGQRINIGGWNRVERFDAVVTISSGLLLRKVHSWTIYQFGDGLDRSEWNGNFSLRWRIPAVSMKPRGASSMKFHDLIIARRA